MLGIRLLLEAAFHPYTLSFQDTLSRMSEDTVMSSDCLVPLNKDGIWFSYNLPNTDERPLLRNTCLNATRIIYQSRDHEIYHLLAHATLYKLLVFSVTPFKIDQNKNQNLSIDKVQNLGNERRYICKDSRQDSGQRDISYTRYPKKCFTKTYRDLYADATLVLTWMSSNTADGNKQKHLLPYLATKREFILRETHKH